MGDGCELSSPVIPHPPFHLHHHHINITITSPIWESCRDCGIGCMQPLTKKTIQKKSKKIILLYALVSFYKFPSSEGCTRNCTKVLKRKKRIYI
jgi:hypothetical protein